MIRQSPEQWRMERLAVVPGPWRQRAMSGHQRRGGDYDKAANQWLRDLTDRMRGLRVPIDLSDSEIRQMADRCAREAMSRAEGIPRTMEGARARMAAFCERYGIKPPEPERITRKGTKTGTADGPAIKRMTCPLWWRRRLRVAQGRGLEREAITLGIVHKHAEPYASNATVKRRQQQKARNALALENTTAVNLTTEQEFTLADLAERSNANPRIRRGELMTRLSGFEIVARGLGHVAEFVTLTAPSKYHAMRSGKGGSAPNPKYQGATPRETQSYLVKVWARIRAAMARYGIRFYGFRVAEPHADATPHWHMVLFMPQWLDSARRLVPRFRAIFRRYALAEDGTEAGARSNRCEFIAIDPAKGSAAGYLAKYISKNIDGYQVQADFETGKDAVTSAPRVEAWASTWGIRQFQQVGGAPVGVWRELRRMEADEAHTPAIQAARIAADCGGRGSEITGQGCGLYWADYTTQQGGPTVERASLTIRTAYTNAGERLDASTGEIIEGRQNRYGETAPKCIFGVRDMAADRAFVSRAYLWEIKGGRRDRLPSAGRVHAGEFQQRPAPSFGFLTSFPWIAERSALPTLSDEQMRALPLDVPFLAAPKAAPWTRVNNCTEGGKNVATGYGFEAARGSVQVLIDDQRGRGSGGDPARAGGASAGTGGTRGKEVTPGTGAG